MAVSEREAIFREVAPIAGFYPVERDQLGPFVWSRRRFSIRKPEGIRFLDLFLSYYGLYGKLVISQTPAGGPVEITLSRGWIRYAVDLGSLEQCDLDFEVTPLIPVPGESRELGVMIRDFGPFRDVRAYERERKKIMNKRRNVREFFSGRSRVDSMPTRLRISLETRCNMSPRCSYCEWEWMKELEEQSSLGEPLSVLKGLGPFFECAEEVVDCGYGEPLLNPNLEAILKEVAKIGARFEMTSNGHLLDWSNRSKLLGKDITLCISIDAATEAGYRRLRHGSLDRVVKNIQALCEEKRNYKNLPKTIVSFIAMRSNLAEFDSFLDRMAEIGVDAVKLRSLYENPQMSSDVAELGSRGFDYQSEILRLEDWLSFQDVAKACAQSKGVELISEFDFCRELEEIEGPVCNEPWQSLYALKRGLVSCFCSGNPLAPWDQRGNRPLIEFVAEVWNGGLMREIREALAAGEFHDMCRRTLDCPIAKRKSAAGKPLGT
ncbi:MAG: radical SAM protein [Desulfomonilaceae bacterium]